MQPLTGGSRTVQVDGETVRQIINNLELKFPGTKRMLCDEVADDLLLSASVIVDGNANQLGMFERVQGPVAQGVLMRWMRRVVGAGICRMMLTPEGWSNRKTRFS